MSSYSILLTSICVASCCSLSCKGKASNPDDDASVARSGETESQRDALLVRGYGFQFPMPPRFRVAEGGLFKKLPPNATALVGRARSGDYRPTIIVSPVRGYDFSVPMNINTCREIGKLVAKKTGARMGKAAMIRLPLGPACQYSLTESGRATVSTKIIGRKRGHSVDCVLKPDDEEARKACSAVLWRFAFR